MNPKDRAEAIDKLKMLHGLPPHDGFSIVRGDGYFAKSIVQRFGMSIAELEKVSGFTKVRKRIGKLIEKAGRTK